MLGDKTLCYSTSVVKTSFWGWRGELLQLPNPNPALQKRLFFSVSCFVGVLLLLLLHGCARQMPPSGGPPDRTPPEIVEVKPENHATNVPRDQRIVFTFSESMDHKSLEKAIFIAPNPGEGGVKYDWSGHELRLEFADSLAANRTYVITLGTDLKDSHNNPLTQSYTLAFSTGDRISDGRISGRVFTDESAQGILIWAYIVDEAAPPDPEKDEPAYVTQADARGEFILSNLSAGRYRIFAIKDTDRNRFFETGIDGIGVPAGDIELATDTLAVVDANFRIAIADTLGPALVTVSPLNRTQVVLRFDEALASPETPVADKFIIRRRDKTEDTLAVRLAYQNPSEPQEVMLVTAPQPEGVEHEVMARNLYDLSGNPVDPQFDREYFSGSALPDTFKPRVRKIEPADSAYGVFLDSGITVTFDEPIQKSAFENALAVTDSSADTVAGAFTWDTPASVRFRGEKKWQTLMRYFVTVPLDSVVDLAGNQAADTLFRTFFTAVNVDTFSSISGVVSDPDSGGGGAIYLTVAQEQEAGEIHQVRLAGPGPYKFENLLPGSYQLRGFRDRDGDGKYGRGHAFPFEPAERFFVYPQLIKVRARWPNEGNNVSFPTWRPQKAESE